MEYQWCQDGRHKNKRALEFHVPDSLACVVKLLVSWSTCLKQRLKVTVNLRLPVVLHTHNVSHVSAPRFAHYLRNTHIHTCTHQNPNINDSLVWTYSHFHRFLKMCQVLLCVRDNGNKSDFWEWDTKKRRSII